MSEVYSWCNEGLADHLNKTAEVYASSFEPGCARLVKARASVALDDDVLREALRLAPLLHDLGKARPLYQQRVRPSCPKLGEACRECLDRHEGPSFAWHEVLSAHVVVNLFKEAALSLGLGELHKVGALVGLAVLMHHQAMRSPWQRLDWVKDPLRDWNPYTLKPLLERLLEGSCLVTKRVVEEALRRSEEEVRSKPSLSTLRDRVASYAREGLGRVKLYTLISGPLVLSDWIAARASRGSGAPHPMVEEALNAMPKLKDLYITLRVAGGCASGHCPS